MLPQHTAAGKVMKVEHLKEKDAGTPSSENGWVAATALKGFVKPCRRKSCFPTDQSQRVEMADGFY